MAEGLNRAILVGNLGADPELKYTQGGQAVLKLRIATTESFMNKGGERQERTDWHNVVVWGKRGEALNKFLSKGRTVWVEGRIQTRSWEDKDGGKRYATDIVANQVGLVGGGGGGGPRANYESNGPRGGASYDSGYEAPQGGGAPDYDSGPSGGDDDIPF
jgi:single-strand DNA-binding protein